MLRTAFHSNVRNFNMEPNNSYMAKLRTTCNQRVYKGSIKIGERNEYKS